MATLGVENSATREAAPPAAGDAKSATSMKDASDPEADDTVTDDDGNDEDDDATDIDATLSSDGDDEDDDNDDNDDAGAGDNCTRMPICNCICCC